MQESITQLLIGIFLILVKRILDSYLPTQLDEVKFRGFNINLKQWFKGFSKFYMDKIYPKFLGIGIGGLFLAKGIELYYDHTGFVLYFHLVFYALIGFYLVLVCLSIPTISKKLGKKYDSWDFKYKNELFKYLVIPVFFIPATINLLYDFMVLTIKIFYS